MAKATAPVITLTLAFLTSCGGPEMWIPQGNSRPAVTREHVQYLDSPPQRPYRVIGIITPPSREYKTLAEAVKAIRKEAAKHGADAVYIDFRQDQAAGGSSGRTFREVTFRAKAIVWEPSSSPSALASYSRAPMFPMAKEVPGKPGYVSSPFDTKGRYIDVSGYPPGSKVKDPWTDKIFIVP
jgi:hypothetical protein